MHTPTAVFVHNEIVCFPITKAYNFIMYKRKQWKQALKSFQIKTMPVGLVKQVLKQEG